jgi:membrane fusion protein (multidrug efflux system)
VVIGTRRVGEVEVREGLAAGEFVVIHGTLRLRPGQSVAVTAVAEDDAPLEKLLEAAQEGRD